MMLATSKWSDPKLGLRGTLGPLNRRVCKESGTRFHGEGSVFISFLSIQQHSWKQQCKRRKNLSGFMVSEVSACGHWLLCYGPLIKQISRQGGVDGTKLLTTEWPGNKEGTGTDQEQEIASLGPRAHSSVERVFIQHSRSPGLISAPLGGRCGRLRNPRSLPAK